MSRIGKYPVALPAGSEAKIEAGEFHVKGSKSSQTVTLLDYIKVAVNDNVVEVTPETNSKRARQNWGTMRALIQNAVTGATAGFTKKLLLQGVGYRATLTGSKLELSLGLSHPVIIDVPEDIKVSVEGDRNNALVISGHNKQTLGQFASNIRAYRVPEPYGGKGIRYDDEYVVRKEGKKKK
ncbi:MAG: 50S ribosomal protein L6 [Alphaproteobacteria bacterium]